MVNPADDGRHSMSSHHLKITQLLSSLDIEVELLEAQYQEALKKSQELAEENNRLGSCHSNWAEDSGKLTVRPMLSDTTVQALDNARMISNCSTLKTTTIREIPAILSPETRVSASGDYCLDVDGEIPDMDLPGCAPGAFGPPLVSPTTSDIPRHWKPKSPREANHIRPKTPVQEPALLHSTSGSDPGFRFPWVWGRVKSDGSKGKREPPGDRSSTASKARARSTRVRSAVGQFCENEQPRRPVLELPQLRSLNEIVRSSWFDAGFSMLILFNSIIMGLEAQYRGIDLCRDASVMGCTLSAKQAWPGAEGVFRVLGFVFGSLFLLEVLLKIVVFRTEFVKSAWNLFDLVVALLWVLEEIVSSLIFDPTIIRLGRMARLVRLARMARTIQSFDSLQVLLGSLAASTSALWWSTCLLCLIQVIIGLFLHNVLQDFISDPTQPEASRKEVYNYFGTFSRSMISMFELTLANWPHICWVLVNQVSGWYGLLILAYKVVVGFAVVVVVTGVFLHETFKVASSDDDLMLVQKQRATKNHVRKMERLFKEADTSCDGLIDREEFKKVLTNDKVQTWLSAMELEVSDPDLLFDFLDDGDEMITVTELINGVARLKGAARNIDVVALMRSVDGLFDLVEEIQGDLGAKSIHSSELRSSIRVRSRRVSREVGPGFNSTMMYRSARRK